MVAIDLGAERMTKDDKIDPKAGIIFNYKIGEPINKNVVLAELFSDSRNGIETAKKRVLSAINIAKNKPEPPVLIKTIID